MRLRGRGARSAVLSASRSVLLARSAALLVFRSALRGAQAVVVGFQPENTGDAGEVDAVGDEDTDAAEPGDVGVAGPAGAALGAGGFEQSLAFAEPQRLHAHPGQFGGDGDAVHPGAAVAGRPGWR